MEISGRVGNLFVRHVHYGKIYHAYGCVDQGRIGEADASIVMNIFT